MIQCSIWPSFHSAKRSCFHFDSKYDLSTFHCDYYAFRWLIIILETWKMHILGRYPIPSEAKYFVLPLAISIFFTEYSKGFWGRLTLNYTLENTNWKNYTLSSFCICVYSNDYTFYSGFQTCTLFFFIFNYLIFHFILALFFYPFKCLTINFWPEGFDISLWLSH